MTRFFNVDLFPEDQQAFSEIAEAHLRAESGSREFMWVVTYSGSALQTPDSGSIPMEDPTFTRLRRAGLLDAYAWGRHRSTAQVTVTPKGIRYYEHLRTERQEPADQVTEAMRSLVDGAAFQRRHPNAARALNKAIELLWHAEAAESVSAIGHHLRESLQWFATELLDQHSVNPAETDSAKTIKRLAEALDDRRDEIGNAAAEAISRLIDWWKAVNADVQRVEHALQNETTGWEDARRACFLTLVLLTELDTAFHRSSRY